MSISHAENGVDRLTADADAFGPLRGARLALVSHDAAVTSSLEPSVLALRRAGLTPRVLVTPEHGFSGGGLPGSAEVPGASEDFAAGARIVDGYRIRADELAAELERIDVVLIDLADLGARCSTYLTMLDDTLTAAASSGSRVIILDRANPLGRATSGPVLEASMRSYVGRLPAPLRHGLSIGECARLLAPTDLDLEVITVKGWDPRNPALPVWVPPSPNLPTREAALTYTGTVLLEGIGGAEPRGTALPYQLLGAPWLDAEVIASVRARQPPGLLLRTTTMTPTWGQLAGRPLPAVQFHICDPLAVDPLAVFLDLLATALAHGHDVEFLESFSLLAGTDRLLAQLLDGQQAADITRSFQPALERYADSCADALLYPGDVGFTPEPAGGHGATPVFGRSK